MGVKISRGSTYRTVRPVCRASAVRETRSVLQVTWRLAMARQESAAATAEALSPVERMGRKEAPEPEGTGAVADCRGGRVGEPVGFNQRRAHRAGSSEWVAREGRQKERPRAGWLGGEI
jgi:hypothetical protein